MPPLSLIPVAEGYVYVTTRAFGQRPEYLEHGIYDDTRGMREIRGVGVRVVEVARMIKYATEAGVVLPEEYRPRRRKAEEEVFVRGVWRRKA